MTPLVIDLPWPDAPLWENRNYHWREVAKYRRAQKQLAMVLAQQEMRRIGWSAPEQKRIIYTFRPPKSVSRYDTTNASQAMKGAQDGACSPLHFDDSEFEETILRRGEKGGRGGVTIEIGAMRMGDVSEAMATVRKAMEDDPGYAIGWHANLAVMLTDEGVPHDRAQEQARGFMARAFDVRDYETS